MRGRQSDSEAPDSEHHPEVQRLARGGVLAIIGLGVNGLFSFLFLKVVGGHFIPASAGSIFIALTIFAIIAFIAPLGSDIGLLRYMPIFRGSHPMHEATLCRISLIPTLVVSIAMAAATIKFAPDLAVLAVRHGNRHLMERELVLLAPFIPFYALTVVGLAGLRGWSIRPGVMIQYIGVPTLRIVILVTLVTFGRISPLSVALSWGAPLVVAAGISCIQLMRKVRSDGRRFRGGEMTVNTAPTPKLFGEFWIFSAARSVQAAFGVMVVYIDVVFVGGLVSSAAAGIYTIASRYTYLGTTPAAGVAYAIGPRLSHLLHRGEHGGASAIYRAGTIWIVMLSWPILLILANFSPIFMGIFGNRYHSGNTALAILAFAMMIQTVTGNNTVALNMAGKSGANVVIGGLALATNVGMNLWLIPRMGINGAALAWLVTNVVTQGLTTIVLFRSVRLSPLSPGHTVVMSASVICFGVLGAAIRQAGGVSVATLVAACVVGSVFYALILLVTRYSLNLENLVSVRRVSRA